MTPDFTALKTIGVIIEKETPLWKWTTFQLGGPCPYFFSCSTPRQLEKTVEFLAAQDLKFILIGGGSNLVVSDDGIDCAVVRYASPEPMITHSQDHINVSGSTSLDSLALYAAEHGLEGLNYTSGIPGTVGGAIVGNAGAFGKQVGDTLKSVMLLTPSGKRREAQPKELGFTYRNSKLKDTGEIVVTAVFSVRPAQGGREALLKEREDLLKVRWEKHPNLQTHPCAGSFFRNIEPTSKAERRQATGWFLEQAGGKSLSAGGARIFEKHANIIVKGPGCHALDVYELSQKMAALAKQAYGLNLIREVRFVGRLNGVAESEKKLIW